MFKTTRLFFLMAIGWTLLMGAECVPPGDDDDDATAADDDDATATDDDDDVTADDDDATPIGSTTIEGSVIALDRESGAVLGSAAYHDRAGGLILYVLPDGNDLSTVFGKMTMTGPGPYSVTIHGYVGPVDVLAVVDEDKNFIIDSSDVLREHAFNPLGAAGGDSTISGVNVYVDLLPAHGGGNGDDDDDDDDNGGCPATELSGDVLITGYPDGPVVVTTNSADLSVGPREYAQLPGAQPWSIGECDHNGSTAVLGCLDADGNGFWEPSDVWGDAPANPYVLGIGDVPGITVSIPAAVPFTPPAPPLYVSITGTVSYDDFLTGNIVVNATAVNTGGQLYSQQTIAAPGPFELVVPAGSQDVLVWAVLDDNSDGSFDVQTDPWDSQGPLSAGSGVAGVELVLGSAPPSPGSIAGTVEFAGTATGADCLTVGLFDTEPTSPTAIPVNSVTDVAGPAFPFHFEFTGVQPGQYWTAAYLDIGCDDPPGPSVGEPDGRVEWPVQLGGGEAITDVLVLLEE